MKTSKKVLALAFAAILLVAATVVATVAYLTSSDEVVNTFTVGKVAITLDEGKVTTAGVADGTDRVKTNTYKLMPGHTYAKDPTVHVAADSEDCWLFVKVVNEIAAIEDAKTVASQMTEKGWALVGGQTNIYAYNSKATAGDNVIIFESFKIKGDVTSLSDYAGKTITVTACAVQADGFESAADAFEFANFE